MRVLKIAGLSVLSVLGAATAAAVFLAREYDYHLDQVEDNHLYNHSTRKLFMTDEDALREIIQPRRELPQDRTTG